jgi:hypothetical protein
MPLHKDEILDSLAERGNVAQFVAYRPNKSGPQQSTSRIAEIEPNTRFGDMRAAVTCLLRASVDGSVNIRSYLPEDPQSREFIYGITSVDDVIAQADRLLGQGLHLIINETIDVSDGGVSGVAQGDALEFSPDDTPRAVEKPDVASLPREMGLLILERVYGFAPELPDQSEGRVEFSIHPGPRGWRQTNTLLWEIGGGALDRLAPRIRWPNRFSRHLGDKVFGLLVAEYLGAAVPATTVVSRRVAPFRFGKRTGRSEYWLRTCPRDPQPGLFTTTRGWQDPFALLAAEDPDSQVASILAQEGVRPEWSGAALVGSDGTLFLEGKRGSGDDFMLGSSQPEPLPETIRADVSALHSSLADHLGPVRIEWVHDGEKPWVVQLHVGATRTSRQMVVDGEAADWRTFDVANGLSALRQFLPTIPDGCGLELRGEFGLTSHIADVVRKWGRPARIGVS